MADLSKEEKRAMMKKWKAAQEKKYILSKAQVKKYFAFLENVLEQQPCDHTLRYTQKWLAEHYKGGNIDDIIEEIKERARKNKKTIVLPESEDRRIYEAAAKVLDQGIANVIIIGKDQVIRKKSTGFDISGATLIDPEKFDRLAEYIGKLVEIRKSKGMTAEMAQPDGILTCPSNFLIVPRPFRKIKKTPAGCPGGRLPSC